ncbi:AMP-binding protein [Kibdelosporangium phytohabitans]|uniref:2-aminobenzoate-CoA ligase n=1 Tax=Kibdelosporangium phytohabitans TaxID=860235 RepID=A0A0N9I9X1_9PSEU|nr:AMP-binding protein [Kibdelosporangium phytohabitans]ALG11270.1 2-aminobenzoate-CoA ligase [Kibdelosporangium phytohabitans]MBE1462560.1 2-aminobenzoate-CoA ligase [Kibdelosporangium phytohabitans]
MARTAHVDTFCRDNLPPDDEQPEFLLDPAAPGRLNCAAALLGPVHPDRPCLRTGTEVWTYGDLDRRSNQLARVLTEDHGLVPGNRVLLRGPNNPWLVAAWFGVLKAGGVAVTTMPLLRAGEIATMVEMTRPSLVVSDDRFTGDLAEVALPVLTYPGGLRAAAGSKPDTFDAVDTAAEDVALLAATSGTTGKPKATMHFHRDVLAIADTFGKHVLRPHPDDVFTGTPPIGFTFGLGGLVIFPMRVGASTLLLERATPDELADAIARHRVTVLFTAPTAYKAMLATGKAPGLTSLRRCVSAGEHLPAPVWEQFHQATGVRIIDGIGGTELLHIFISAADDDIRPGSTGKPVPGYEAVVIDDDGRPVPDGTPGRLAVKGPTGCRYLADPRQRTYVHNGWNVTGDTFVRDADGYFWYRGRTDDMIISAGYNIAGPEVESVLAGHPDVSEVAVVGAPDPDRGMVVKAFVVLRNGVHRGQSEVTELQDYVKRTIAPYKYPRVVEFLDELPKTSSGKIQRFKLRRMP